MAARRLLVVMLVFLAISTVLAALAPRPIEDEPETTTTQTTTATQPDRGGGGRLVRQDIDVHRTDDGLSADPERIEIEAGDQLALTVRVPETLTLAIPSLGLTDTASPGGPARFDLFLTAPGQHRLVELKTDRVLARVVVSGKGEP